MTVNHEVVAAVPISGAPDKSLLRALIAGRLPYVFGDADDPTQFVAVDPDTGDVTQVIIKGGALFFYDSADSTTASDGVTCWVSSDGKRYKLTTAAAWVNAVLDKDTTAQPSSPSLGDAYLLGVGVTGTDWAGHDGEIAVYTARGWVFAAPDTGRLLYVADEESYYHYEAAGDWVLGIGLGALGTNDVAPANMLGGRTHYVVENQTTNTPPSPAAGVAYIIGSSPTGAWSGKSGQIAIRDKLATGWIYVAPTKGLTAYDKTNNLSYVYSGAGWVALAQGYSAVSAAADATSAARSAVGSTAQGYSYATGTAPTSTQNRRVAESVTLTLAADFAGQNIDIEYFVSSWVQNLTGASIDTLAIGVFVDSEINARQWKLLATAPTAAAVNPCFTVPFVISLADTSSHTISIILFPHTAATGGITGGNITVSDRALIARRRAS